MITLELKKRHLFYVLGIITIYLLLFHFKYRIYPKTVISAGNSYGYYANLSGVYSIVESDPNDGCNLFFMNTIRTFGRCRYKKIEGANPLTFRVFGKYYAKDHNQAFIVKYYGDAIPPPTVEEFEADPSSLEVLNHFAFAKDKNAVYYYGRRMDVDMETFKVLDIREESSGHHYPISHDKNFYYFRDKVSADYDPNLSEEELINLRDY